MPHASWKAHCLMTRNLLFDLELLAHADYFVGTSKSGLTPIIEVLQQILLCVKAIHSGGPSHYVLIKDKAEASHVSTMVLQCVLRLLLTAQDSGKIARSTCMRFRKVRCGRC